MNAAIITQEDVVSKAAQLNITVNKTAKSGKVAWEIVKGEKKVVVVGNTATIEMLEFLGATTPAKKHTKVTTPIKLKKGVLENPNGTTQVMMMICDNPNIATKDLMEKIKTAGVKIGEGSVIVIASEVKKTLAYLQQGHKLLA